MSNITITSSKFRHGGQSFDNYEEFKKAILVGNTNKTIVNDIKNEQNTVLVSNTNKTIMNDIKNEQNTVEYSVEKNDEINTSDLKDETTNTSSPRKKIVIDNDEMFVNGIKVNPDENNKEYTEYKNSQGKNVVRISNGLGSTTFTGTTKNELDRLSALSGGMLQFGTSSFTRR